MRITRRTALALLAALPASARADTPHVTVVTPGAGIDHFEAMNLVSGGHLAAQGLDGQILSANGQAPANNQVIAGQAQFTRSSALDLFLAAKGGPPPLVAIATLYQGSTFHVISPSEKPIARAEDLEGKTVGVVSVKGTTELLLDLMLRRVGIASDRVRREAVGNNPGALALVQQGRIDAFIASVSVVVALRERRAAVEVWNTDHYAPMPSQAIVTTPALIAEQPDLVVRYLRALDASCRELLGGDLDAITTRLAKTFDIQGVRDRTATIATEREVMKLWLTQGRANLLRNVPSLWAEGAREVQQAGLAQVGDPTRFYTNALIEQARRA
jgi:NitT/TauT family transport system substrate-binding protein